MNCDTPILAGLAQTSGSFTSKEVQDLFDERIREEARERKCDHDTIKHELERLGERDLKEWVRSTLPHPSETNVKYPDAVIVRIANDFHRYLHPGDCMEDRFGTW